jgi:hypothetical protein
MILWMHWTTWGYAVCLARSDTGYAVCIARGGQALRSEFGNVRDAVSHMRNLEKTFGGRM